MRRGAAGDARCATAARPTALHLAAAGGHVTVARLLRACVGCAPQPPGGGAGDVGSNGGEGGGGRGGGGGAAAGSAGAGGEMPEVAAVEGRLRVADLSARAPGAPTALKRGPS